MTAVKKAIIILSLCAIWFGGMLIGFGVGTAMADEKHSAPSGTDRRVEKSLAESADECLNKAF